MNLVEICIGDRWNDGHGRYDKVEFTCNRTEKELSQLYSRVRSELGINFSDICSEYDDSQVDEHTVEKIHNLGLFITEPYEDRENYEDETYLDSDSFVNLMLRLMKHLDPTFEFGYPSKNSKISWDPGSLGYGLFSS